MNVGLHTAIAQQLDGLATGEARAEPNAALLARVRTMMDGQDALPPPPDNTMRDLMAQEAVRSMRVDRDRALARKDTRDDDALLRVLEKKADYTRIVRMISLVARFAGELKHTLIHPTVRNTYEEHGDENDAFTHLHALCNGSWDMVMDPGLSGNARIACENLARALPQLQGLTVDMVLDYGVDDQLLDYFCAAVAARWRANTVFAAGPYKTGNEQNAVTRALKDAVLLCRDYRVVNRKIEKVHHPQRAPTTLAELRGRGGPFASSY